jgi:4-hydroxybenzoate polyprenyltransferase
MQQNPYSNPEENAASFLKRFYRYQNERFPILGHGLLVASFSFSAIAYSRICRGAEGFVSWPAFGVAIFTTITLFLLVRIFDEFKDAEDDAQFRPHLPVPRGLIRFRELFVLGAILIVAQVKVNALFFPKLLILYAIVIVYLSLMGKEFFIAGWLKKHQFWYVTSHMFIIPLIDIYASGLDWMIAGTEPPKGLIFFFIVSYMNGIVLEIGRKIRIPEKEATGVLTYTAMLGAKKAVRLWLGVLLLTLAAAIAAAWFAGHGWLGVAILCGVFAICSVPAFLFLSAMTEKRSKMMEWSSALWTIAMYLTLGGVPMLQQLFFQS